MPPLLKVGLTLVLCLAVTGCSLAPGVAFRGSGTQSAEHRLVDPLQ